MKVSDFDYDLPERFIAQAPAQPRDSSRLLRFDRQTGAVQHLRFSDIVQLLRPDDILVMNNTRVIKARLKARKAATGGLAEILLLRQLDELRWLALLGGRNIGPGMVLNISGCGITCEVLERRGRAAAQIKFSRSINDRLDEIGQVPLPPYIRRTLENDEQYQTVYNSVEGSAAAPTAGLHFTDALLEKLRRNGVKLAYCTLHIGLDTFQPVTAELVEEHSIHSESILLDSATAASINEVKAAGARVIAVGTTSARTLESAAQANLSTSEFSRGDIREHSVPVKPISGRTDLFITPGYQWRAVDALITNFHLPRSTLLMMLSAFVGREKLLALYELAKAEGYRFYSFGDAMIIT